MEESESRTVRNRFKTQVQLLEVEAEKFLSLLEFSEKSH